MGSHSLSSSFNLAANFVIVLSFNHRAHAYIWGVSKYVKRPETTGNDMRNHQKRWEMTGKDMRNNFCLSMCVYSLIKVSLLVLVTNCIYECMCHPAPSPSKHGNTKKKSNQAHIDAFIYNIWEKSNGK